MTESASQILGSWSNFYVMIGSAAAALTGLMFVVITLVTGAERKTSTHDGIGAFSTPTVLYFCAAFVIAAILSAPWHELFIPGILIGLVGLFGVVYVVRIMYRATRLETYRPDLEDWTWFWCLPFLAFAVMLGSGIALPHFARDVPFLVGAAVVLLIFIGIRNAWDVVTFLAISYDEDKSDDLS